MLCPTIAIHLRHHEHIRGFGAIADRPWRSSSGPSRLRLRSPTSLSGNGGSNAV